MDTKEMVLKLRWKIWGIVFPLALRTGTQPQRERSLFRSNKHAGSRPMRKKAGHRRRGAGWPGETPPPEGEREQGAEGFLPIAARTFSGMTRQCPVGNARKDARN